jgi:excisionase family DNA binding protein
MNDLTILTMSRDDLKRLICEAIKEMSGGRFGQPAQADPALEQAIGVEEAAKLTGLCVNTLYEKTRLREIPHYKKGKRLYFRPSELAAWIGAGRIRTREETEALAATKLLEIKTRKAAR